MLPSPTKWNIPSQLKDDTFLRAIPFSKQKNAHFGHLDFFIPLESCRQADFNDINYDKYDLLKVYFIFKLLHPASCRQESKGRGFSRNKQILFLLILRCWIDSHFKKIDSAMTLVGRTRCENDLKRKKKLVSLATTLFFFFSILMWKTFFICVLASLIVLIFVFKVDSQNSVFKVNIWQICTKL